MLAKIVMSDIRIHQRPYNGEVSFQEAFKIGPIMAVVYNESSLLLYFNGRGKMVAKK